MQSCLLTLLRSSCYPDASNDWVLPVVKSIWHDGSSWMWRSILGSRYYNSAGFLLTKYRFSLSLLLLPAWQGNPPRLGFFSDYSSCQLLLVRSSLVSHYPHWCGLLCLFVVRFSVFFFFFLVVVTSPERLVIGNCSRPWTGKDWGANYLVQTDSYAQRQSGSSVSVPKWDWELPP